MTDPIATEFSLALMWDFDGTLMDTAVKNLTVTRSLVEAITGKSHSSFPSLVDLRAYHEAHLRSRNWREFYGDELGLSIRETDEAGRLWTEYQLQDTTDVAVFDGLTEAVEALGDLRHGIVSQNSRANIVRILDGTTLSGRFDPILGFDSVPMSAQKPAADGLIACLRHLTGLAPGFAFYVGDHVTDFECVENARRVLADKKSEIDLRSIGVGYGRNSRAWPLQPDFVARRPGDIPVFVEQVVASGSGASAAVGVRKTSVRPAAKD
jgi:phosphoglycolate phosphatase-like HAD superfamily hydrolase